MGYIDLPVSGGGITIYPNLAAFPPSAQDGAQGVAADTNSIYIYNASLPGWVAVATPPVGVFISDLTGDVTATGPGSAAATVAFVGGESAADVAQSVQDTQAATDLSTVSTIVKRDASGQTSLDGLNLDGSTSGAISIQAANTTTSYTVKMPSAQGASSSVLQNDGSGNLSWSVLPTPVTSVTGSAPISSSGGTTPAISISQSSTTVDGYLSATNFTTFNNAATDVSNATALSTVSTLVKRDSNGETALDGLTLDGSTSGSIKIQSAASVAVPYTVKMPNAQGAASTFLQNDGSGNLSWAAAGGGLPSQTGNADKVLATDGSSASWQYAGLGDGGLGTGNVVLGRDSLITSGINNTVIGVGATGITTTNGHVVIGSGAAITGTGDNCISIGREASSKSGSVAVGQKAICSDPYAVAIGQEATAPEGTVAIGHFSQAAALATYAVCIGQGSSAAKGTSVAVGYEADTDERCVNIGAVSRSGTGTDGTFVGFSTGKAGSTGANNTAIGSLTGNALTSGASNVFVGKDAGKLVTTGSTNVFVGNTAGDAVTTGNNNVIIGDIAGTSTLADTIILAAGTTERMRIDSSGNLSVPNYILSPQLYDEGTETGNFTLNLANGPAQQVTINAAGPLVITLSNPVTGGAYLIKIIQGATPGTVTWPANVLWGAAGAPTLSLATGDIDIINLFYDGTDYYGTYALGF